MARQALRSGGGAGGADDLNLGMGGRIAKFPRAVAIGGNDAALRIDQHRAHRHLAAQGGGTGLIKGLIHM